MGSLVMNENHPSTCPWVSGVGSNCTTTLSTLDASMLLALRKAAHTASLGDWTPIFLPIMSWGVLSGLLAADMMQKGFFWYWVPMTTIGRPFSMAAAVESSDVTATRPLPVAMTCSWAGALGPEGMMLTELNPCCVQNPLAS